MAAAARSQPVLGFAAAPEAGGYSPADDPLAPLLMRGSLSYAADTLSNPGEDAAQQAIGLLAAGAMPAEAGGAAAAPYSVQVGAFGDPANADRMARLLSPYGTVVVSEVEAGGRLLQAVRLEASGVATPETVLAAAAAAGATGAFVIGR
jgi:hypothetical protein